MPQHLSRHKRLMRRESATLPHHTAHAWENEEMGLGRFYHFAVDLLSGHLLTRLGRHVASVCRSRRCGGTPFHHNALPSSYTRAAWAYACDGVVACCLE